MILSLQQIAMIRAALDLYDSHTGFDFAERKALIDLEAKLVREAARRYE